MVSDYFFLYVFFYTFRHKWRLQIDPDAMPALCMAIHQRLRGCMAVMDMGPGGDVLEEGVVVDGAPQPKRKDTMGKDVNSVKCVATCCRGGVVVYVAMHRLRNKGGSILCRGAITALILVSFICTITLLCPLSPCSFLLFFVSPMSLRRRFLNRMLGLPVADQNLLYNYFFATLASEVRAAKAEGRFVDGVSELPGETAAVEGRVCFVTQMQPIAHNPLHTLCAPASCATAYIHC